VTGEPPIRPAGIFSPDGGEGPAEAMDEVRQAHLSQSRRLAMKSIPGKFTLWAAG
jgi:hypothetical protein